MSDFHHLLLDASQGILTITLNRPDKLNALNIALIGEVRQAVQMGIDDDAIFGMILTGSGEKAFAAGADIAEFKDFSIRKGNRMSMRGHDAFNLIEGSPKPVFAAVNGFALGGGLELAMACHLRIASENAHFGQPEINLGVVPGYGGSQRLPRLVGRARATEMLLTGRNLKSGEALQAGLVSQVVPQAELQDTVRKLMANISEKSPRVVRKLLNLINDYYTANVDGFANEIDAFGESFGTADFKEGTTAFIEKRKPNFVGH
mgnify:CR=1 FL=1